jgi:hypothetical protein
MIGVISSAALGDLLALRVHGGQLERFEMMLEQYATLGLGLVHGDTSSRRAW